jgi:hypothetical protein
LRIISPLFTVASLARDHHVAWNMEACSIAIHAVEMLNHGYRVGQVARAIWASVIEQLSNKLFIFFAVNSNWPLLADPATQFVKKHAHELVRDVRFGSSCCGA